MVNDYESTTSPKIISKEVFNDPIMHIAHGELESVSQHVADPALIAKMSLVNDVGSLALWP